MKRPIEVSEELMERLSEEALKLNVPASELAEAAIRDLLGRGDEDFRNAAARVLAKNRELYRRLV